MGGPSAPPLEITEADGSPDGRPITKIIVSNGDLSISGRTATIDTSGAGGTASLTDTYVGFGDASDLLSGSSKFTWVDTAGSEKLTITGSNTSDTAGTVKIVNTDNSASSAPDIIFYHDRGSGNAANGDYLGQFVFSGRNSANNEAGYVRMFARASNVTSGDEDGQWFMQARVDGTYRSFVRLQGSSGKGYVTINEDGIDNDFRVECLSSASGIDAANAIKLDGATGNLGLGVATATPALQIKRDNTITDMNSAGAAGITLEQDGTGDAALSFLLTGTMRWMMGVDNSDSDKLKWATGGTDLATGTKVTVDTNGYVGIGEDSPATELHVKGDSTAAGITIESTEASSGAGAPDLILYRNKGTSTAVNDDLGEIRWQANTADGTKEEYASIYCEAASVTNGQESSRMRFYGKYLGTSLEYMRLDRNAIIFNELVSDIDIRMESTGNTSMFMLNSGNDNIGLGGNPDSSVETLHVLGTGTGTLVRLESTDAGADVAPNLQFYRNSASPAPSDYIGSIEFTGNDDGGAQSDIGRIQCYTEDETATTENGVIIIQVAEDQFLRDNLVIGSTLVTVNSSERNVDFRVKSDDGSINLYSDAGTNQIGIGATPESGLGKLQVNVGNSATHALTLVSTDNATDDCPSMDFYRKADVADGRYIGEIIFSGYEDGTTTKAEYCQITAQLNDDSTGTLDGTLSFTALKNNTLLEHLRVGAGSVTVNEASGQIDFRVEADVGDSLLRTSATSESRLGATNSGIVAIGKVPDNNQALLQVELDASYYRWVIDQKTENHDVTADEAHGGILSMKASATGSRTFTLPETGVIGMHCSFINMGSNGMDIAVNSSSSHKINNGGSAGNSTTAVYTTISQRVDLIYIEANQWVATLGTLASVS